MLTIIYDNNAGRAGLTPAWGFACIIRGLDRTILFDTGGDGGILLANMRALGIKPWDIDVIVLSHVHGDHTGGLWDFLRLRGGVPVYMPEGFPPAFAEQIAKRRGVAIVAGGPTTVCDGAVTTGTMGAGRVEEQGLCVRTADGWILITGCAHPGIAEMVEQAGSVVDGPLHLVIGGFHLGGASRRQIESIIDTFERLNVATAAPCHCSGDKARAMFEQRYGPRYIDAAAGTTLRFGGERDNGQ